MNTYKDLLDEIQSIKYDFDCKFNSLSQDDPDSWDPVKVREVNVYFYAFTKCIEILENAKRGEF